MSDFFHRAILPSQEWWSKRNNRLSTAVFKDKNGLSVDRQGTRTTHDTSVFLRTHKPTAVGQAIVSLELCVNHRCRIETDPTPCNPHHHLILGEEKNVLKDSTAKSFVNNCVLDVWIAI